MYNVNVSLTKTDAVAAVGVTFANTVLTVTDAAGEQQVFALVDPFTQAVTVTADGPSTYSAQDTDTVGNPMGAVVTVTFTPEVGLTFPSTTAISVTAA